MNYELKPGFDVSLEGFHCVKDIYDGMLEGDPEYINKHICLEILPTVANEAFFEGRCDNVPIHIRIPEQKQPPSTLGKKWMFPRCCCFALLYGPLQFAEGHDRSFQRRSMAVYCWFVDNVNLSPEKELDMALEPFDWDAVAKAIERD